MLRGGARTHGARGAGVAVEPARALVPGLLVREFARAPDLRYLMSQQSRTRVGVQIRLSVPICPVPCRTQVNSIGATYIARTHAAKRAGRLQLDPCPTHRT